MTSLIDVIFLLLLFFMLSSTFSRFAEIELSASGQGGESTSDAPPLFLQLGPETVTLNGQPQNLNTLAESPFFEVDTAPEPRRLLVSLRNEVSAQRLTDLLVILRQVPNLSVTVLGN